MEPLVVFGAGLVAYCGWLAVLDEIQALKKWHARQVAARSRRARTSVRSVPRKGKAAATCLFAGGSRLPQPLPR